MAAIVIREFRGIAPAINDRLLPDGHAVIAINTKLSDKTLRAWRGPTQVATLTKPAVKQTIYRFGQLLDSESLYWFSWTGDVDVVRAPIDGDTSERTYYTGDGYPKVTDNNIGLTGGDEYPVLSYRLGVPAPDVTATSAAVTGTATDPDSTAENSAYVLTYVTVFGEESMPSAHLGVYTWRAGQSIDFSDLPSAPTGNYNVVAKRLYRSATGSNTTAYQFVAEIGIGTTTYSDTATVDTLGETVATWGWEMLPDAATGLCLMANGIGAAFLNSTLYLSEPYALYAWPAEYRLSTDSPIVGIAPFGQSLFVGTRANPFVVTGIDPGAMSVTRLDQNQACISKRSIVPMMGGVVYATPDGLWLVAPDGMRSLSEEVFNRDNWQAYRPSSFKSYELDGRYVAFFDTGSRQGALVFDFKRSNVYELDQYCTAAYNDPIKDRLFMSTAATTVSSFDTAIGPLQYRYRTKVYRAPEDVDISYGKIEADSYPVLMKIFIDGVEHSTYSVFNNKPFRVQPMRAKELQIDIDTVGSISCIALAETGREIVLA